MTSDHRIVVSCENGAYHGWQAKLFYYSCVTRLNRQPIFIVHENGRPWHSDFHDLARAGAVVRRAPSYVLGNGLLPRNTAGTLLQALPLIGKDEFIVLCDPDMIFVRKPRFRSRLAANHYHYMNYQRPVVEAVVQRFGMAPRVLRRKNPRLCVGVPYVIPAAKAAPLADLWLKVFDAFPLRGRHRDDIWQDIMYAFGIAVVKMGWDVEVMDQVDLDLPKARLRKAMVHYCWGTAAWSKRRYLGPRAAPRVWHPTYRPSPGSVLAELFSQITEAREFYRDPLFEKTPLRSTSPERGRTSRSGKRTFHRE